MGRLGLVGSSEQRWLRLRLRLRLRALRASESQPGRGAVSICLDHVCRHERLCVSPTPAACEVVRVKRVSLQLARTRDGVTSRPRSKAVTCQCACVVKCRPVESPFAHRSAREFFSRRLTRLVRSVLFSSCVSFGAHAFAQFVSVLDSKLNVQLALQLLTTLVHARPSRCARTHYANLREPEFDCELS